MLCIDVVLHPDLHDGSQPKNLHAPSSPLCQAHPCIHRKKNCACCWNFTVNMERVGQRYAW
jgi:hypothetical protein